MSIGPLGGVIGSAAGAPLSQTKGSETERAAREGAAQDNRVASEKHADAASGIGTTEEDQGAEDRDADGRRLWEDPADDDGEQDEHPPQEQPETPPQPTDKRVKDPKGEAGSRLDLLG